MRCERRVRRRTVRLSGIAAFLVAVAAALQPATANSNGGSMQRLTPDWDVPGGWEVTHWAADNKAGRVFAVRGTEPATGPRQGWLTRDLVLLDSLSGTTFLYGPESGVGSDPVSRMWPAATPDGRSAVFATYRRDYPQGTDLRLWRDGDGQTVVFSSGRNNDLDFGTIDTEGRSGAVVEIVPLGADNPVFRMRIQLWSLEDQPRMLIEHQQRHITGLAMASDTHRIIYCLQNHAEKPDSGEIRLIDLDGTGTTLLHYVGVAGPVAISADGRSAAAFLPGAPTELGGPTQDDPGIYLWREGRDVMRLDGGDTSADRQLPLSISADGASVSWAARVWREAGIELIFGRPPDTEEAAAMMTDNGANWTVWLSDGPSGRGLYALRMSGPTRKVYLPLAANERRPTRTSLELELTGTSSAGELKLTGARSPGRASPY